MNIDCAMDQGIERGHYTGMCMNMETNLDLRSGLKINARVGTLGRRIITTYRSKGFACNMARSTAVETSDVGLKPSIQALNVLSSVTKFRPIMPSTKTCPAL